VHAFPEAGLGVSVATDGCIYQSEVFTASTPTPTTDRKAGATKGGKGSWGGRAVLVLVGIRLGLDGVNPVYYDTIKVCLLYPMEFLPLIHTRARTYRHYTRSRNQWESQAADLHRRITLSVRRLITCFTSIRTMRVRLFRLGLRRRCLRWRIRLELVGNVRRHRSRLSGNTSSGHRLDLNVSRLRLPPHAQPAQQLHQHQPHSLPPPYKSNSPLPPNRPPLSPAPPAASST
jgi:Peptidase family C54